MKHFTDPRERIDEKRLLNKFLLPVPWNFKGFRILCCFDARRGIEFR